MALEEHRSHLVCSNSSFWLWHVYTHSFTVRQTDQEGRFKEVQEHVGLLSSRYKQVPHLHQQTHTHTHKPLRSHQPSPTTAPHLLSHRGTKRKWPGALCIISFLQPFLIPTQGFRCGGEGRGRRESGWGWWCPQGESLPPWDQGPNWSPCSLSFLCS